MGRRNNFQSEIGLLVDDLFFYRRHGDWYMEKLVRRALDKVINQPPIDLRPLPPELPHPCPPESLYGDDIITV